MAYALYKKKENEEKGAKRFFAFTFYIIDALSLPGCASFRYCLLTNNKEQKRVDVQ